MEVVYQVLRLRRKYVYELAQELEIGETRLRKILKGRTIARPDELSRIAAALGLDAAALAAPCAKHGTKLTAQRA